MENLDKAAAPSSPPSGGARMSPKVELWFLVVGLLFFLLINLLTAEKSPTVWCDEVMYSDPAVNWYQGHGFTSGAWFHQTYGQFWAGNVPLYQMALFIWLKIFGFSLLGVRSLHYVLFCSAILVSWAAIRRGNIIRQPAHRLLFCVIVALCTVSFFTFRFARPESLAILLVALAFLAFTFRNRATSVVALVMIGALLAATGLQFVAYIYVMTALAWLMGPKEFRVQTIAICAGCMVAGCVLFVIYHQQGVWGDFVVSIRHHTVVNTGTSFQNTTAYGGLPNKLKSLSGVFGDYSFVPLLILVLWMMWDFRRAKLLRGGSLFVFGLVACLCVPVALNAVGIFPIYYFWTAFFPMVLGLCVALGPWLELRPGRGARLLSAILIFGACAVGFPRRLLIASAEWNARDYQPVMHLLEPHAGADKVIACDFSAYYAAKQHGAVVLVPSYFHLLTDAAKSNISVAAFHEGTDAASVAAKFGGSWRDTGEVLRPESSPRFHENLDSRQYELRVFVRQPSTP